MKRIVWLTDPHLNFLMSGRCEAFLQTVAEAKPDALLISGDIAESLDICHYLEEIEKHVAAPVYFVLGNHDYYYGSIAETRQRVAQFCDDHPRMHFLTCGGVVRLTERVGLVGHDGWADGRLGNYERSLVTLQDWKLIEELKSLPKMDRWQALKELADDAAAHIGSVLSEALARFEQVIVLTHVPPYREACWHEGAISDGDWAPHFTCQAVGQAILAAAAEHPERHVTVLCGHTHGSGETWPAPNVHVITGGADYGRPSITRVWQLE